MRIHKGATVEEHMLADIDSLTFREIPDDMVWIPAGNVRLGQAGIAEPVNDFYVEGFYIDIYEVSNAKYKAFIDAGGYTTEAYWNPVGWAWRVANGITLPDYWNDPTYHGGGIAGNEQFPVNGVSWWEADAYCRWAGGRLPTEAEWEKAAKGGCETHGDPGTCDASDTPTYPWGEGITGPQANYSRAAIRTRATAGRPRWATTTAATTAATRRSTARAPTVSTTWPGTSGSGAARSTRPTPTTRMTAGRTLRCPTLSAAGFCAAAPTATASTTTTFGAPLASISNRATAATAASAFVV